MPLHASSAHAGLAAACRRKPLALSISALLLGTVLNGEVDAQSFPAVIDLGSLDGVTGFRLDGEDAGDSSGHSVSNAGDVNGDGIDDVIVGAYGNGDLATANGRSYVLFGRTTPFAATLALGSIDGVTGFRIDGEPGDQLGFAVSAAGDINGDGRADLLVTAPIASDGNDAGSTFVVFGRSTPFPATLAVGSLNGSNGFRIDGVAGYDYAGRAASAAGDINGDGLDDLVIGAPFAGSNGDFSGRSYVVFGRSTPFAATLALSGLDGSNGFRLDGVATGDQSGRSVTAAGDINGDGHDDLIIGAYRADTNGAEAGASYVVFGRDTPFAAVVPLGSLDGSNGFRLDGTTGSRSGTAVCGVGDINDDGLDDLLIGAPFAVAPANSVSYVVFGRTTPFAATLALGSLDGTAGLRLEGPSSTSRLGFSVGKAGDTNGDGIDDLIIGAYRAGTSGGSGYVVFGQSTPFVSPLSLGGLDGRNGFRLDSAGANSRAGFAVSTAGDLNGDGFGDVIVGAPRDISNGIQTGSSYVVFGRDGDLISSNGFE